MSIINACTERDEMGGGLCREIIGVRPIAYLEGGVYKRAALDWVQGDASFPHLVSTAPIRVSVAADGMRRIHPTRELDRYLEIGAPYVKPAASWQKVAFGTATRAGNRVTWHRAEADLSVTHAGHYIKLEIELLGGYVPPNGQFAFPVGMTGLTRTGGNIYRDGVLVMALRAPQVYDAANTDDVRPITTQFVQVASQWYVLCTLPSLAGMTRPVVDPTFQSPQDETAGADTYINAGNATWNFGVMTSFQTGKTTTVKRAQLQIGLSSIPPGSTALTASLYFYCTAETDASDITLGAHKTLTQWFEGAQTGGVPAGGEDASTWNLRNANGSVVWAGDVGGASALDWTAAATASVSITGTGAYNMGGLTADVNSWLRGASNYGWWLINASETTTSSNKTIGSGGYATASRRPQLTVVYALPGRIRRPWRR
jgi:hypothetical protein